ncbi:MAG TPA: alkaline phosphatase D family protein, partial [Candidatus Limnocylindrales bacterium]
QVYADETSEETRAFIRARRDTSRAPGEQVADFEEYARLYREAWSDPDIRWLLATVPSTMIFDDHDVHDDWNTSQAWRDDMARTSWWERRITGALMSYWIYQHLGNLAPAALEHDPTYRAVRAASDGEAILRAFARAADEETDGAKGTMWSYRRDFGPVRLLVVDSRCGRILADGRRSMISDKEFEWVERQATDGSTEHLVVVTSMPWLLPRALHDIESWNEALCAGSRGRLIGRAAEWVRRAVDLEHWAAFRASFDRLTRLFERVGGGEDGEPAPATICVLSGDVHHSYVSEADYPVPLAARIYQITCSPIENTIPFTMRMVFRIGWSKTVARFVRLLGRLTRVPPLPIYWHHPVGPLFGNMLSMLTFDAGSAEVRFEGSAPPDPDAPGEKAALRVVARVTLTEPRATP